MTTANHSTNQAPHGLGNLGQIIEGQEQFKILTTAEIEALPEAEYLAYCKQAFAMPTTGRTLEEIEASATEILKELNGHNAKPNSREQAEEILDGLKGANLMATVRTLNGLTRGGYKVTITQDAEYNEVQCRLRESTRGNPIATGFIDRGHTKESRYEAAEELRGLVRAYLCR